MRLTTPIGPTRRRASLARKMPSPVAAATPCILPRHIVHERTSAHRPPPWRDGLGADKATVHTSPLAGRRSAGHVQTTQHDPLRMAE